MSENHPELPPGNLNNRVLFNINDDFYLNLIWHLRYGDLTVCPKCGTKTKFYRIKKRQGWSSSNCNHQLFPLAGTIFDKSTTPLSNWFKIMQLLGNGTNINRLHTEYGINSKTAWRIAHVIKQLEP